MTLFPLSKELSVAFSKIVGIYKETKEIIIYAEESDSDCKYNIQIWKELRDAFDHLMRIFIIEISEEDGESYSLKQLEKSYDHIFRAAYDATEGIVFSLEKNINEIFSCYDVTQLLEVAPDYPKDKETIYDISEKMTVFRGKKDIGKTNTDFNDMVFIIEQLKKINKKYIRLLPLLENIKKERWKNRIVYPLIIGIVCILIGSLLTFLIGQ